jgi:hypothetical protein
VRAKQKAAKRSVRLWASQKFAMACPLCGDRCTCSAAGNAFAGEHTAVLIDPESNYTSDFSEQQFASSLESSAPMYRPSRIAVAQAATAQADPAFYRPEGNESTWRNEIAERVQARAAVAALIRKRR